MEAPYEFDVSRFRFGRLCPSGHQWAATGHSLRYLGGSCVECQKASSSRQAASGYHRQQSRAEYRKEYKRRLATQNREQGLTTRGRAPVYPDALLTAEEAALYRAIRTAGRLPSVARLVMDEQKRYWAENPEAKAEHDRQWAQASWWLTYQTRPDLRLYHREKSRRRKARDRGATAVQVSATAIRQRFNEFGNSCAYCGVQGDMEIEHVVATSKGGAHDIGNIVPACSRCNTSKRTTEMECWYRAQPFFSELRLRHIHRVLHAPMGHQLALALC